MWEYTVRTWENIQYVRSVRIHDTYMREYSIRTDFSVRIKRYDTQCVQISPRKLHKTIHSTYVFPCTNYTIQYIVRMEVLIVPEGSRMNNTIRTDSQCLCTNGFSFKLYFLLLRNKISLQSVESLNRTFFFRTCNFSVVLRSNHWSKGIASVYQTLLLRELFNHSGPQSTLFTFRLTFISF